MAVEMHEELLAHGAVVIEELGVLPRFVKPNECVGQVEECDASLADDLQIGRAAEGGGFVPLRSDVAAARDLSDRARADLAPRREVQRHYEIVVGTGFVAFGRTARGGAVARADDACGFAANHIAAPIDHFRELSHVVRVK